MPLIKTDRESIIRHAIHLFKVHGYSKTSMADIGRACGLIKGSIYHHFSSKERLCLECLRYIHEHFASEIFSIAYDPTISSREKLLRFLDRVEIYFQHSEGGCLMGNLALESINDFPAFKREIISYFDDWIHALTTILMGVIGHGRASEMAHELLAATQGGVMMVRVYGQQDVLPRIHSPYRIMLAEQNFGSRRQYSQA